MASLTPRSPRLGFEYDPDYEDEVLGFGKEAIEEATAFLRAQPNFDKIDQSIKAIHGREQDLNLNASGLSTVSANHIGKAAEQLAAGLTDTRPFWEYKTENENYKKNVEIFGKMSKHYWLQRQWDMRMTDMVRLICTGGTSYAHLGWDDGLSDLSFSAEDVRDVLPIRPSSYHTIQDSFGVIIHRERTVNYLQARYPDLAPFITPDRDGSMRGMQNTRYERLMDKLGSPFREKLFGTKRPSVEMPRVPTCDEYTMYLNDRSLNETKETLYMGVWHLHPVEDCIQCIQEGTPHAMNNWSYEVKPGQPIYPNKRLIIFTTKKVLYDNTSPYWHGMYPVPKLTLTPWSDTFIGKGLIWDALPMQKFLNKILRLIDNHFQKWNQPDLFADKNSTAMSEFNKINTARAGLKIRQNPLAGKGVEIRYPDQLPNYVFEMLKFSIEEINTLTGAHDLSQLTQLNQLPSADAVERITESMTPEVRLRSRVIEAFTREFAMIVASNISQFCTIQQRMAILGPQGITVEDFDYDPNTLIPAYIHSEDFNELGQVTQEAIDRGPMPRYNRSKEFLRQTSMYIAPGSLLSASEIESKLMYLQFARQGWLDPETLANKWGIPNYGTIPGSTVIEKLAYMAQMGVGQSGPPVGRPPTAQEQPKAVPDGDRVKISESG